VNVEVATVAQLYITFWNLLNTMESCGAPEEKLFGGENKLRWEEK